MVRPVPIADIVRSGFVEGHHYGSVVALAPDGSVDWSLGDINSQILPRSCNKPLQAVGMLRAGLDLDGELLALAAASHSGEEFHIAGVRQILADVDLDESFLQTPPDYPLDDEARLEHIRAGRPKSAIAMNCSGKHAAMLATCVANGWPIATYRLPEHPLQRAIKATFEALTGEPARVTAVDGCGAPLLSCSLSGLATAFRKVATAENGPEMTLAYAIRTFPEFVSGTRRDEKNLVTAIPGLIGKAGAEACYAVGLSDGRAVALKVHDGAARARPAVMASALDRYASPGHERGWATGRIAVVGGGEHVGSIRPLL